MGQDIGSQWRFSTSVGGEYVRTNLDPLNHGTSKFVNTQIMSRKIANNGDTVNLDIMLNAVELDLLLDPNDVGSRRLAYKIVCEGTSKSFRARVGVVESGKKANMVFKFLVTTKVD